jgi:nucleotide-binding universal stress UspA family protein
MIAMRTILCPVDFSDATARQAALAAGLARLFGARLVLHHNMTRVAGGAGVGWMWSADHPPESQESVGQRLDALAAGIAPGLDVELSVTEGPASQAVLAMSDAVNADLVVLSTHRATTDEHTSVTASVLGRTHRSVLALHDAGVEPHALTFDPHSASPLVTLVPTDLTQDSHSAVAFAFELARTLPLELHLLHFVPSGASARRHDGPEAAVEKSLRALIPADLLDRTHVHVREGDPVPGILHAATDLGAACIVMGEHTRSPLRRWFSQDTSSGVLHEAPCPVWYVAGPHSA